MFLFAFIAISASIKPVLLVPGLIGSRLHGNVSRHSYWFCPKIENDDVLINDILMIPPLYKCLLDRRGIQKKFQSKSCINWSLNGDCFYQLFWYGKNDKKLAQKIPRLNSADYPFYG